MVPYRHHNPKYVGPNEGLGPLFGELRPDTRVVLVCEGLRGQENAYGFRIPPRDGIAVATYDGIEEIVFQNGHTAFALNTLGYKIGQPNAVSIIVWHFTKFFPSKIFPREQNSPRK